MNYCRQTYIKLFANQHFFKFADDSTKEKNLHSTKKKIPQEPQIKW